MRKHFLSSLLLFFADLHRLACASPYEDALRHSLNEWSLSQRDPMRSLQQDDAKSSSDACHICGAVDGIDLMEGAEVGMSAFFSGMSCQEADAYLSSTGWPPDSTSCIGSQTQLMLACCNATGAEEIIPTYACEDAVQSEIVATANPNVVPLPSGRRGPLNVTLHLEYIHLTRLSTEEGTAEIYARLSMDWLDERLRWDPAELGGCSETTVRASLDRELTDIWVPDVDLQNRVVGVHSFGETSADLYANGRVRWQRMGALKALCSFTGLESFPYDTLGCAFTIGTLPENTKIRLVTSNILTEGILNIPGLSISPSFKPKYQEFTLAEDMVAVELPLANLYDFVFYFRRASRHYTQMLVIPTILFTFVSFGMFFLDQRHGERLSFGVTFLLVLVAQGILTTDLLPVCEEELWASRLTNASYCWVIAGIFESIVCAALFWAETDDHRRQEKSEVRGRSSVAKLSGDQQLEGENHLKSVQHNEGGEAESSVGQETERFEDENYEGNPIANETKGKKLIQTLNPFTLRFVPKDAADSWKLKTIRRMDRICIIFFPTTYIIFISVLFAHR